MNLTEPRVRKLFSLLYLAGFMILADQLIEIAAPLLSGSPSPSQATWRFGAFGIVTGRISALLVADAFFFAAAIGLEQRLALRVLGWLHLALAGAGVLALILFGLDSIEVGGRARGGLGGPVTLAAARAGGMMALTFLLAGWAGVVSLRASRKPKRKGQSREVPPLVQTPAPPTSPPAGQPRS